MSLFYDPTFIILIPALILTIIAQARVSSTYARYRQIPNRRGISGFETAQKLLSYQGINIPIDEQSGYLSDHYDPLKRRLRLSPEVGRGQSIASVAVSAHEVGHAIQHATHYFPIKVRTLLFPITSFASSLAPFLFIVGFLMQAFTLIKVAVIFFSFSVVFALITLPVEFNASKRALALIQEQGIVSSEELKGAKKVLSAAALTYLAGALTAILELLRWVLILRSRN